MPSHISKSPKGLWRVSATRRGDVPPMNGAGPAIGTHFTPPNFVEPEPRDEGDKKLQSDIKKFGCHVVAILSEKDQPEYLFSVGMYANYGTAEVLIFGPNRKIAHGLINEICYRAARGQRYMSGDRVHDLLKRHEVCFVDIPHDLYPEYLGYATWFYTSSGARICAGERQGKRGGQPVSCEVEIKVEDPTASVRANESESETATS